MLAQVLAQDLIHDAASHTTRRPDGIPVPHVTAILAAAGLTADFEVISSLGQRVRDAVEAKRDLGSVVHADSHAYDDEDLDESTLSRESAPYVRAWAEFRFNRRLRPLVRARERLVYHPVHNYAGILDGIFVGPDDRGLTLVDIKTGDPRSAAADLQLAAYKAAWEVEHPGESVARRLAVWLRPRHKVPYKVFDYSDRSHALDLQKFLACLVVFNEQVKRGRRAFS